jgi:hypothetical protein
MEKRAKLVFHTVLGLMNRDKRNLVDGTNTVVLDKIISTVEAPIL